MRGSFDVARRKDLGRYGIMTGLNIRGNFEMIWHGEKEGYLVRMERFKMGYGRKAISSHSIDHITIFSHHTNTEYYLLLLYLPLHS